MKDFLKFTLATIVGLLVTSVVMFFISMLVVFGMASSAESETQVNDNSVMTLNLNGVVNERSSASTPFDFLLSQADMQSYGLDDILASIKKAKENDKIKGIYLQCNVISTGWASLQAIRDALVDFKESGKFIVAYADNYMQGSYYIASVADKVVLNPSGGVDWRGLAAGATYYKDLLDKLGVEMQIFKVGTYKSAVEPYFTNEMSEANREQLTEFVQSIWGNVTKAVAESRHLTVEQLQAAADSSMLLRPAEESIQRGLADTLMYKSDMRNYLKQLMELDEDDDLHLLDLQAMINVKKSVPRDKSGNIIAVYYAEGGIDDSSSSYDETGINSKKMVKELNKLKENDDVKAVVLRINSPGGSAFGSEQIWYAIKQLKEKKPVIVSMGNYAASGGYYIACNADTIVAEPTTLTGSIGIFGMIPNLKGLVQDKLGVHNQFVKTNRMADFGDVTRPMSAAEKALMQKNVNNGYDLFLTRCAEGRGMDKESINRIAQGRVWTGEKAKELGLVDLLGGIDTALEIAISKADVESYTVMSYPEKSSFIDELLSGDAENVLMNTFMKRTKTGRMMQQVNQIEQLTELDPIQARLPFGISME